MSRRVAGRFVLSLPAIVLALAACGGAPREAAAPPPITAAKAPAPTPPPPPAPSPTPSPTPAPLTEAGAPQPATPPTVTTSAPGAVPPARLPGASAQASPAADDPLKWLQDKQARKADYDRRVESAQADVAAAQPDVDRWERNVLAIKNPFLAPPRFTAEESQATQGMNNVERLKFAQDKLAEAKAKLADAQKTLDELKANPVSL